LELEQSVCQTEDIPVHTQCEN